MVWPFKTKTAQSTTQARESQLPPRRDPAASPEEIERTIRRLPPISLTAEEYSRLPRAETGYLHELLAAYPVNGTLFLLKGSHFVDHAVIGQVVDSKDADARLVGGFAFGLGPRYVNRYKPVIREIASRLEEVDKMKSEQEKETEAISARHEAQIAQRLEEIKAIKGSLRWRADAGAGL